MIMIMMFPIKKMLLNLEGISVQEDKVKNEK